MTHNRPVDEGMTELGENSMAFGEPAVDVAPARHAPLPDVAATGRWPLERSWPAAQAWKWCVQGGASILQQGLFAGAHFAVNILLARWLSASSYGVFALAYSVYLLLLAFYMAAFYDPILIFGPGRYSTSLPQYVQTLACGHFILLPPVCLAAAFVGILLAPSGGEIRWALMAVAAAAPLLLFIWLCRAAFYAQLQVWQGTAAGGFYLAFLVGFVWMLQRRGMLSPASALLAMAAGSLLVSVAAFSGFLRPSDPGPARLKPSLGTVVADHWRYGKWAALTAVAAWFPVNIYYSLLPPRFGMESAAALRALMNLMYPLLHALLSLVSILVPTLVKRRRALGVGAMRRTVWKLAALFLPAGIAYLCVLVALREPILHLLYGNRYANQSVWEVLCIGSLPITTGVAYVLAAGLRAIEAPQLIFYSYLASLTTTAVVGVPLALRFGIAGAAGGMVASDLPTIAVLGFCLAKTKIAPE